MKRKTRRRIRRLERRLREQTARVDGLYATANNHYATLQMLRERTQLHEGTLATLKDAVAFLETKL